jgi:hypothetical protein
MGRIVVRPARSVDPVLCVFQEAPRERCLRTALIGRWAKAKAEKSTTPERSKMESTAATLIRELVLMCNQPLGGTHRAA